MTDEEIIRLVKKGRTEQFSLLVERYQEKIYGLCYKMLGHWQDGEDLAQEIFLKAYNKLATFNFKAKFSTWLYRIAVNACYDYLRQSKEKKGEVELKNIREVKEEEPEERFQEKERLLEIDLAVKSLSQEQQIMLNLRLFGELSYEQIAKVLKITPEAAKMRYYRARNSLQKKLSTNRGKVGL